MTLTSDLNIKPVHLIILRDRWIHSIDSDNQMSWDFGSVEILSHMVHIVHETVVIGSEPTSERLLPHGGYIITENHIAHESFRDPISMVGHHKESNFRSNIETFVGVNSFHSQSQISLNESNASVPGGNTRSNRCRTHNNMNPDWGELTRYFSQQQLCENGYLVIFGGDFNFWISSFGLPHDPSSTPSICSKHFLNFGHEPLLLLLLLVGRQQELVNVVNVGEKGEEEVALNNQGKNF